MTNQAEQRRHPRRDFRVELTFVFDRQTHRGEGLDLGLDGIGFRSGLDIPNGYDLKLSLGLPSGDNVVPVMVWGTVRWHLEELQGVYRYGIAFDPLDSDQQAAINNYLADARLR